MAYSGTYKGGKNRLNPTCNSPACQKKWHVFYLRSRTENLVCRTLTNLNYEVFWPVIHSVRIWKNRQKKKIKFPLFPNYLFVYTYTHELYFIKRLPQVVSCVTFEGKPATISEKEIEGIRRMLGIGCAVSINTKLYKGEYVRIVSGPLKGHEGILIKQHGKTRFGIQLKSINHAVFIEIDHSDLEKL